MKEASYSLEEYRRVEVKPENARNAKQREELTTIREGLLTHAYKEARRENKARSAREQITRLNADPDFAAARDKRASERMTRLHKDPVFAAARNEQITRLNAKLSPVQRRNNALKASETRRRHKAQTQE